MIESKSPNEFGEEYFESNLGQEPTRSVTDLILKYMSSAEGDRILDVGCGRGFIEKMLSDPSRNISVVSSDVTEVARQYIQGEFVLCSMADMPFPDNSFDKIFCLDVIAHFKEAETGLKEAHRVLKKGGKLMIITPNKYYVYYAAIVQRIRKLSLKFDYDDTARWIHSKSTLSKMLSKCPWTSIEIFYHEAAPRRFPKEWMRQTIVAIVAK